jgi:hypothetical protein
MNVLFVLFLWLGLFEYESASCLVSAVRNLGIDLAVHQAGTRGSASHHICRHKVCHRLRDTFLDHPHSGDQAAARTR